MKFGLKTGVIVAKSAAEVNPTVRMSWEIGVEPMLAPHRDRFRIRILHAGSQVPAGAGVVAGDLRIVTCAHVVSIAAGRRQRKQDTPEDNARVEISFPILDGIDAATPRACLVAKWSSPPADRVSGEDVASMALVGQRIPAGKAAARLVNHAAVPDALLHTFGYSGDLPRRDNGAWTRHRLAGLVGGGLAQLDVDRWAAIRAQLGHSGSPVVVFDEIGEAVVGMLGAASRDEQALDYHAIPASMLAQVRSGALSAPGTPPRSQGASKYGTAGRGGNRTRNVTLGFPFATPRPVASIPGSPSLAVPGRPIADQLGLTLGVNSDAPSRRWP